MEEFFYTKEFFIDFIAIGIILLLVFFISTVIYLFKSAKSIYKEAATSFDNNLKYTTDQFLKSYERKLEDNSKNLFYKVEQKIEDEIENYKKN